MAGGLFLLEALHHEGIRDVHLVEDDDLGNLAGINLGENGPYRCNLALRIGVRCIHHMEDQVRIRNFLQRGAEGLNELGWE